MINNNNKYKIIMINKNKKNKIKNKFNNAMMNNKNKPMTKQN